MAARNRVIDAGSGTLGPDATRNAWIVVRPPLDVDGTSARLGFLRVSAVERLPMRNDGGTTSRKVASRFDWLAPLIDPLSSPLILMSGTLGAGADPLTLSITRCSSNGVCE